MYSAGLKLVEWGMIFQNGENLPKTFKVEDNVFHLLLPPTFKDLPVLIYQPVSFRIKKVNYKIYVI